MNKPSLISVINEAYLDRAQPFLRSLKIVESANRFCVCLGFYPTKSLSRDFPYMAFLHHPEHWANDRGIFQYGRWIDALPIYSTGNPNDVLIYTDADIVVQRDFTPEEIARFISYDENIFGAGWNAFPGDDLELESKRIEMTEEPPFNYKEIPCYNTGVVAMRERSWRKVANLFESLWGSFITITQNRSRSQWLINLCLHQLKMKADVLGGEVHTHGHFGMPPDAGIVGDKLYYLNKLVMFRHFI